MRHIKIILILALISPLFSCSQTRKVNASNSSVDTSNKTQCIAMLGYYNRYWIADSTAKSGFRELLADKFLRSCNFSNTKWSDISDLLGKPNAIFSGGDHSVYRYRLNNYGDNYLAPGTMYLEITIKEGVIIKFVVRTVEG